MGEFSLPPSPKTRKQRKTASQQLNFASTNQFAVLSDSEMSLDKIEESIPRKKKFLHSEKPSKQAAKTDHRG